MSCWTVFRQTNGLDKACPISYFNRHLGDWLLKKAKVNTFTYNKKSKAVRMHPNDLIPLMSAICVPLMLYLQICAICLIYISRVLFTYPYLNISQVTENNCKKLNFPLFMVFDSLIFTLNVTFKYKTYSNYCLNLYNYFVVQLLYILINIFSL